MSRSDLRRLGFSDQAIKHRVATGRLHPVTRGVYAVGRRELTPNGRWMAAVRACGKGAALSHGSAAALWRIGREYREMIEVSVRRRCRHRRRGLIVRSRPALPADDVAVEDGIAVTTPARTLLDLATVLSASSLERAVNDADKLDLIDPEALRAWLDRRRGEPGVRALRRLLDEATFVLSDEELEVRFRPIARAAGLPQPLTKRIVNKFEVDFWWPDLGLVVETDGLRYHRTATTQARDLKRDQTHTAAGLVPLRFSHYQVRYEPDRVRAVLAATAGRR